ncbi:hypothetical protein AURDEDRAFT_155286 [Auricularia subglabra TFB-10046 SS5]|nr:hypothetical protein AURDEDRAFT_155286 [Auricularia subglabra TFB-10046 SS5]
MLPVPVQHMGDPFGGLAVQYGPVPMPLGDMPVMAPQLDPNSPQLFVHNVQVAHQTAMRIQELAQSVINGIEHAYDPSTNPLQTAADLQTLKETLGQFSEFLAQTGVGALPLNTSPTTLLTEQQLQARHDGVMRALFPRGMDPKSNAETVAQLLTSDRK